MLSKTRITIISLVAAASFAVAAVPASAAISIVYEAGGWGHYNCSIGNGVYIKDGSTWTENGVTKTCKNGKVENATRLSTGGGVVAPTPVGAVQGSSPEGGTVSPVRLVATPSAPLL